MEIARRAERRALERGAGGQLSCAVHGAPGPGPGQGAAEWAGAGGAAGALPSLCRRPAQLWGQRPAESQKINILTELSICHFRESFTA